MNRLLAALALSGSLVGCAANTTANTSARDAAYAAQITADLAIKAIPSLLTTHAVDVSTATKINQAALGLNQAAIAVYACTAQASSTSTCSTAAITAAMNTLQALVPAIATVH